MRMTKELFLIAQWEESWRFIHVFHLSSSWPSNHFVAFMINLLCLATKRLLKNAPRAIEWRALKSYEISAILLLKAQVERPWEAGISFFGFCANLSDAQLLVFPWISNAQISISYRRSRRNRCLFSGGIVSCRVVSFGFWQPACKSWQTPCW